MDGIIKGIEESERLTNLANEIKLNDLSHGFPYEHLPLAGLSLVLSIGIFILLVYISYKKCAYKQKGSDAIRIQAREMKRQSTEETEPRGMVMMMKRTNE